jgi:hypothetical protein
MHLTLIFVIIISYSTVNSHPLADDLPLLPSASDHVEFRDEPEAQRPLVQFFKKIFGAFRPKYASTTESPLTTRISRPSLYHSSSALENFNEIPNFVDFSTYLLDSFASNNSAIKFSYVNPNSTALRGGDYSVISFLVPLRTAAKSNATSSSSNGVLSNFLSFFRFPWRRDPNALPPPVSETVYQQFPSFFEYFAQRVQAYFSIYKYADESRLNNTIVIEAVEDVHENASTANEIIENDELETTTMEAVENTSQ